MNDAFTPISGIPDRLDLVIFDCDGVLIDSEYLACRSIVDTFAQYGITVPVELLLSRLVGTTDNSLRTQLESFGYAIPSEAFDRLESEILNRFRTPCWKTWRQRSAWRPTVP